MPVKIRWQDRRVIYGAISLLLLAAGSAFFMYGNSGLDLEHTFATVYDPPRYIGKIEPGAELKPAWVHSGKNQIYVSYFGKDKVDIFTPEGKKKKSFHATLKPGSGTPQGMVTIGEKLFVSDYENRSILIFNQKGDYIESYAKKPDGKEFFPVGLADYDRVVYVADTKINGWMAIGETGEFINDVKGTNDKNTLQFPYGIAVTDDGRVVITDPIGGKVKVFSCPGWYIGDYPTAEIGMLNPQGIVIDGFGRIHVVDNGTNQVFVYDNTGRYQFRYGEGLKGPSNISIDKERQVIYITNTEAGNISVWGY